MFFLTSCIAPLIARYSLVLSWLAFVLPGTPYFLDKSGRIKRSILGSVLSTIRAETAASPNRMALVMAVYFFQNPALGLMLVVVLMASHEEALMQISQATYQSLVDQLCDNTTVAVMKQGNLSLRDCVLSAVEAQSQETKRGLSSQGKSAVDIASCKSH